MTVAALPDDIAALHARKQKLAEEREQRLAAAEAEFAARKAAIEAEHRAAEDEDPGDVREEVTSPFRGHSQQPAASGNPAPQQRSLNRERKATGKFPKRVVPQSIHSQPAATAAASALSPAQQPADADGAMPLPGGPSTASVQANSHLEGRGAAPLPGGPEAAAVVEEGPSEAAAAAPALPEDISDTRTFFMFRASRSRSSARKLGRRIPARLWQAKGLTPPELNPPGAAAVALRTRLRPIRTNCLAVIKEADPAWWAYLLGSESRAWAEARDRQQALKNRFLPRKWPVWRREYAAAAGLMLPELLESDEESEEDVGAFGIRQGPLGDGEASRAAFDEDAGAVVLPEYGEMSGDLTSLSDSDDEDDTRRLRKKDRSGSESSGGSDLEDAESARSEPDPAELLSDALARLSARAGLPLDPDSSELAALVEAAMQQCSGLAACRSSAEQALVQRRMGETFAAIVAALEGFEQQWREKQKPALQRKAHSIWLAGRSRLGTLETWQDELRHWQQRLLNFAQEIATTHVQSGARSLKGIRRQCESLRTTFDDILEYLVKLKTCEQADAPERPEAQPVLPHRKKQRRMGTGDAVHAEGADLAEQAEGAAFIDADDEGLGSPQGRKEQLAGQKRSEEEEGGEALPDASASPAVHAAAEEPSMDLSETPSSGAAAELDTNGQPELPEPASDVADGGDGADRDAEAGNPNAATSPLKLPAAGLDQDEPMGIAAPHQDPVNSPQAMQQLSSPAETGSRDGRARTAKPLDPVLVTRSPSDDVEDIDIVAVADLSPGAVVEVHVSCSQHAGRSRPIWRRAHLLRQTADSSVVAFLEEPDQEVSKPRSHIRPIPPNSAFITEPSALQWGRVIETIINPDPPRASWCGVVACTVPAVWTDKASAPGSKSGHAPGVRIGQVVDLLNKRRSHPAEPPHSEQVIAHMSVQASDTLFSITAGMLASQRVRRPQEWDRTRSMWLDSSFTADELASLYRAVRPTFKGETIVRPADKRRDEAAVGWLSEQAEAAGMDNTQVLPEGLQNAFVRKYLACRPCAKFAKAFKRMAPAPKKPRLPSKGDWAAADAGRAPPTPRKRAAHRDTAEDPLLLELRAAGAGLFGGGAASRRKAKAPSKKRAGVLLGEDGEELPSVRAAKKRQERADKMDQLTTRAAERRNKRQSLTNTAARNMVLSQGHEQAGHDSKAQPLQEGDSKVLVAGSIAKALKPHQWEGMRFLWRNIVENHLVDDDGEDPGGCILAHSMGLGKSIQTIAFLHTYHTYIKGERTIIVAPANVLHNWKDEFKRWLPPPSANVSEIALDKVFVCDKKQEGVREWHHVGGGAVLIISFQRFAGMATKRAAGKAGRDRPRLTPKEEDGAINPSVADRKAQEEAKRAAEEAELCGMLLNGASVVIADEAHEIKNRETLINSALNRIKTAKRIALTGYPLQNKLDEYYTMICWVKDDLMGDARDFHETFTNPITAGQKKDSSAAERREMAKNLSVLHDLTSDFIHRKGPELLQLELPPKLDHVLLLRLHPLQSKLYAKYIKLSAGGRDLFRDAGMLHKLCDQPADFLAKLRDVVSGKPVELDFATDADADGDGKPDQVPVVIPSSAADVGMDEAGILDPAPSSSCGAASRPLVTAQQPGGAVNNSHGGAGTGQENHGTSEASASGEPQQKAGAGKKRGRKAKGAKETKVTKPFSAVMAQELLKVADAELNGQPLGTLISPKAAVITQLLQICRERGDRLVVFSQWLETLNDIEQTLQQLLGWRKEREYLRLDGHTNSKKRQADINNFNRRDSPAQVYLLSTKAGSLGINLTTACRMVIFDEPWNPVHNAQAIARIYRYGQTQPTYVYRLLYKSAIDQRVYRRNVDKEGLFKRVVDNKTVKGMNSLEDIDIYAYEEPAAPAPVHILGLAESTSDEALARMLRADMAKDAWIADVEDHRKNLPEDPTQVLTMLEKVQAARQFAEKETATDKCRAPTGKPVKNKRLLRLAKVYKEDTALEQAEQKALAELQDDDDQPGPSTAPAAANHGIGTPSQPRETVSQAPANRAATPQGVPHRVPSAVKPSTSAAGGIPLLPGADPAAVLARQLSADARSQQLKAAAKPSEHAGGSLGDLVAGGCNRFVSNARGVLPTGCIAECNA
ncbi:hypothetical protein WJX72_003200 [[Myrmecia] bisecta]|uniref:Uncharacterized protein n=1 Tax=[Myrmecia] bisecta TaxID=41462 RepID=A0AAW1PJG1_9CHLO